MSGKAGPSGDFIDTSSAGLGSDLQNGITPLEAYAFSLNTSSSSHPTLPASLLATSGLPRITTIEDGEETMLQVEHLRRRSAGDISYSVKFSNDLGGTGWESPSNAATTTIVNEFWERVKLVDHKTTADTTKRFGRVEVTYTPPVVPVQGIAATPDGAYLDTLNPTIAWEGTGFEQEYDFELRDGTTPLPNYSGTVNSPWATISSAQPLDPNQSYTWRFRETGGTWSRWRTVTTPPASPTPAGTPREQIANLNPVFTWTSPNGSSGYGFELAEGNTAVQSTIHSASTGLAAYLLAPPLTLESSTSYVWRVRAENAQGTAGPWSDWMPFHTPIELVAPGSGNPVAVSLLATLEWKPFPSLPNIVQANSDANFTGIMFANTSMGGGSFQFVNSDAGRLPHGQQVYWRVGVETVSGIHWSETRSFVSIQEAPTEAPAIISPSSTYVSTTPIFTWGVINDGKTAKYELVITKNIIDTNFSNDPDELLYSFIIPQPSSGNEVSFRLPNTHALEMDWWHHWKVRALTADGNPGPFSNIPNLFAYSQRQTTLIAPAMGAVDKSPTLTLSWSTVDPGSNPFDDYRVKIYSSSDLTNSSLVHSVLVPNTQTQYTVPSGVLNPSTTYYWHVKPTDDYYVFSGYFHFTTKSDQVNLTSPANAATGVSRTSLLNWTNYAPAGGYQVQVDDDPAFASPRIDVAAASSQYQIPDQDGVRLPRLTTYYWRARANGAPWSTVWSLTTEDAAPENTPTLLLPVNGDTRGPRPLYTWEPMNPSVSVTFDLNVVRVKQDGTTVNIADYTAIPNVGQGINNTFKTPVGDELLGNGRTYRWKVRAASSTGLKGPWSASWEYTVPVQ